MKTNNCTNITFNSRRSNAYGKTVPINAMALQP